eukprot:54712-Prymnesium_polylepis.1
MRADPGGTITPLVLTATGVWRAGAGAAHRQSSILCSKTRRIKPLSCGWKSSGKRAPTCSTEAAE